MVILEIQEGTRTINPFQYKDRKDIDELIIADSVEEIGDEAFSGCSNLKKITWGSSIHTIGREAFIQCISLESLHLRSTIRRVGSLAFALCSELTYVEFEDNDGMDIENGAFSFCSGLSCVILPNGLRHIYGRTFSECTKLEDIFFPGTVTSIGSGAFNEVAARQIELPDSIVSIEDFAFCNSKLTHIDIPDSVLAIGESAFGLCGDLKSVEIGKSVVYIERKAFENCSALNEVTFRGTIIGSIGFSVLKGCKNLKRINVPADAMDTYERLLPKYLHKKLVGFK